MTLPVDPISPLTNCYQGSVSPYYIDVSQVSDVQAGLAFASSHGVPLVIKNSGHDYKGRSSAPNSLALWTHNYQPAITLIRAFTPEGCGTPVGDVVTFGAGQGFNGIYEFAHANNVTVVGGSSQTVGAAGGWITGGGHSALSPAYGLGVDNVQQLKAVLPNGTYVTATRCQNTDVFYALSGGGGGTFGVIMEMSTMAHPQIPLQVAQFTMGTTNSSATHEFLRLMVVNANKWGSEGWGGYGFPNLAAPGTNSTSSIILMTPLINTTMAQQSMKPLSDLVSAFGNLAIKSSVEQYDSFYDIYTASIANGLEGANNGGAALASRLVPSVNFEGEANQKALLNALFDISEASGPSQVLPLFLLLVGPRAYYAQNAPSASAVTPAWLNATWHVIATHSFSNEASVNTIESTFKAASDSMNPLRQLTPGSGAYQNEADTFEPDYTNSFWGSANYARLLSIKKQLDPGNILTGHQTIGWDSSDSRYSCYPATPS